jgi:hypothetical protein
MSAAQATLNHTLPIDYFLHLADNALVLGQRNAEWSGHGPILEEDIALSNNSLDLVGQARLLYQVAAAQMGNDATEDTLAFFRDVPDFKNYTLLELPHHAPLASTSASESTSCYRQIIKYIAHLWRRSKRRILRRYRAYRSRKKLQQQQMQLQHQQHGKQQPVTHSLSLRTRRKQQQSRRRKRRRRRSRHPHPQCPQHGVIAQQQYNTLQRNSPFSSSLRVPSVSSQVALRINDGPASHVESPVPILSIGRRASVAVSIDHHHQRSSPFLSPRGTHIHVMT